MYSKKLSILTLICCLAVSPIFAQDEFNEDKFLKEVKKAKTENLNDESINKIRSLLFSKLFVERDGKGTLKISNIEVDASRKLYGEDSLGLGYAYTDMIDTSIYTQSPIKTLELVKKAEAISLKHPGDESLHKNTQRNYEAFYSQFGQPTKALEYVVAKTDKNDRTLHELRYISSQENWQQTLNFLKKLEKDAIKTNNDNLLSHIYTHYIFLYRSIDNYPQMFEAIKKAEKYMDNNEGLKNTIISAKSYYYKELSQFEESKKILEEYYENKTPIEKLEYHNMLCDIEKEAKNYEVALKHVHYMNDFYSDKFPKDSNIFVNYSYSKYVDIYKDLNKFDKAEKYLEKYKELVEDSKDVTPIYYAEYLLKLGNYNNYIRNFEAAKEAQKIAISLYEENEPTTHKLAELYKNIAEAELNSGNISNAEKYIKKALEHNLKYQGEKEKDLKDVYSIYAQIYAQTGDVKNEEKYLDMAINLYSNLLGKNNVKTLKEELEKVNFYNKTQQKEKAEAIVNKVNKIVSENNHIGYSPDFLFNLATMNAWNSIKEGNYEQAEKDINLIKDVKFYRNFEKQEINKIKYQIYKNTGKKLKAYTYKKRAGIKE